MKPMFHICNAIFPSEDQKTGVRIVMRASRLPAMTIVSNAGGEDSVVIHKLLADNNFMLSFLAATFNSILSSNMNFINYFRLAFVIYE